MPAVHCFSYTRRCRRSPLRPTYVRVTHDYSDYCKYDHPRLLRPVLSRAGRTSPAPHPLPPSRLYYRYRLIIAMGFVPCCRYCDKNHAYVFVRKLRMAPPPRN